LPGVAGAVKLIVRVHVATFDASVHDEMGVTAMADAPGGFWVVEVVKVTPRELDQLVFAIPGPELSLTLQVAVTTTSCPSKIASSRVMSPSAPATSVVEASTVTPLTVVLATEG
jgi:hypothetical protein